MSKVKADNKLTAGAARVDITPPQHMFPMTQMFNPRTGKIAVFSGSILQPVFARVLVIDNGQERIVIAVLDLPGVPEPEKLEALLAGEAGVPVSSVMLTATHNHSAPFVDNPDFDKMFGADYSAKKKEYINIVEDALTLAIRQATDSMEPVGAGFAKDECGLNINRHEITAGGAHTTAGFNPEGPADREISMIRFDKMDGTPLAFLYNYAVHACLLTFCDPEGKGSQICGDMPGVCSRLLEQDYDDKAVAIFTSGAAGDLNPLFRAMLNYVKDDGKMEKVVDTGTAGQLILEFMGKQLYKYVRRLNEKINTADIRSNIRIWTEKRKAFIPETAVSRMGEPDEGKQVELVFSLFMLGDIALIASNGEIYNMIGQRLKQAVPYRKAMFITHAGCWTGYVTDDSGEGLYETELNKAVNEMIREYTAGI